PPRPARDMLLRADRRGNVRGFKNFLMRGDVIVVAVGLVVALAFSMPLQRLAGGRLQVQVLRHRAAGRRLTLTPPRKVPAPRRPRRIAVDPRDEGDMWLAAGIFGGKTRSFTRCIRGASRTPTATA